jgi:ankyrin repeat protein
MRTATIISSGLFIFFCLCSNCYGEKARPNLLLQAVKDNDINAVRELLANPDILYHDLNPQCPGAICKPVFYAARNGSTEIMELLIDAGADIDGQSGKSGDTPLIIASYMHDYSLARLLIEKGADVNKKNYFGAAPFWGACFLGDYELAELFIDKADLNSPGRYPDLFKKKGEERRFVENITPLMVASKSGDIKIVQLLVDKGADIKSKDSLGRSAIDYAECFKNTDIKKLLQSMLADN